jgi:hypothetical protein
MPEATYFVKTAADGGNDGNNGLMWGAAKATLNAGLALVGAGGSNIVAVAPGKYTEAVTSPGASGVSGGWNELVGDTYEDYTDSTGATHGVSDSPVTIDQMNTTSGALTFSSNQNFWRIRGIVGQAKTANGITITQPDAFEMYDCIGRGGRLGITFSSASNSTAIARAYRCVGVGKNRTGIQCHSALASFSAAPTIELDSCVGISEGRSDANNRGPLGIMVWGAAGALVYARMNNCAGFSGMYDENGPMQPGGIGGLNASWSKGEFVRCYSEGYNAFENLAAASNYTNTYFNKHTSGSNAAGTIALNAKPQYMMMYPRITSSSAIRDSEGDFSSNLSGEQVYGITGKTFDQTPGAEEFTTSNFTPASPKFTHTANGGRGVMWSTDYNFTE